MAKYIEKNFLHNIGVPVFAGLLLIIASTAWGSEAIKKKEIQVFIERYYFFIAVHPVGSVRRKYPKKPAG